MSVSLMSLSRSTLYFFVLKGGSPASGNGFPSVAKGVGAGVFCAAVVAVAGLAIAAAGVGYGSGFAYD